MTDFGAMADALGLVLLPTNLLLLVIGLAIGLFFGAAPGIQGVGAAALFLPFTFGLNPYASILALVGIYVGGVSSGAITSILFNIPGEPASIPTTFDGYPLQRQGSGGQAIGVALMSSAIGGSFSAIILILAAPRLADFALNLASAEYFAFTVLGLAAVVALGEGTITRAVLALCAGLLIAQVGLTPISLESRLTFGIDGLANGVDLIALLMGIFALTEVFERFLGEAAPELPTARRQKVKLTRPRELLALKKAIIVSALIGVTVGILPGAGATVASLIAYGVVRQISKDRKSFGTGAIEGVAAPETANNASIGGALVPLLALGIPGSAFTAVLLGAFTIHGIQPGPLIFIQQPEMPYTIFIGMLLVTLLLLVVGGTAARVFSSLGRLPFHTLDPIIVVLAVVGVYSSRNSMADVVLLLIFGVVGLLVRRYGYSAGALVLGFVLGPLAERYFIAAVTAANGDVTTFVQRPISASVLGLSVLLVLSALLLQKRTTAALVASSGPQNDESTSVGQRN